MKETYFSHGYNQQIYKNLRELIIAEQIDLLNHELQTLELKNLQIRRSGDSWRQSPNLRTMHHRRCGGRPSQLRFSMHEIQEGRQTRRFHLYLAEIKFNQLTGCSIMIRNGASRNIIGPDNIITYNGVNDHGIEIGDSSSFGNIIAQNSIHDNGKVGIYLWEGGNAELSAPFITDFNLDAGTVTGTACANCTDEIFSDSSNEGEVYEIRTNNRHRTILSLSVFFTDLFCK